MEQALTLLILKIAYAISAVFNRPEDNFFSLANLTVAILALLVSFLSAIVSAFLTYWLVKVVQIGINNRRLLKDHLIREVIEVRNEYIEIIRRLQANDINAKQVQHVFMQVSTRMEDLMRLVASEFSTPENCDIRIYHSDLLTTVADTDEYIRKYARNQKVFKNIASKTGLDEVHKKNIGIFNDLIAAINNAK